MKVRALGLGSPDVSSEGGAPANGALLSARKYRTLVADPPWPIRNTGKRTPSTKGLWSKGIWSWKGEGGSKVPYRTLSVEEIAALPIPDLAETGAHLYLWTINAHVCDAYEIAKRWGFRPASLLTWCKAPRGIGFGGTFVSSTEFVLFARRGSLPALKRSDTSWWQWKRPYENGNSVHSKKPDAFLDLVEQVSPGPYLELFARSQRLGWDTWGDEALEHVELESA